MRKKLAILIFLVTGAATALEPYAAYATLPIGSQSRVSFMGSDGDVNRIAINPASAYSPQSDRSLVVWEGNNEATVGEYEIYGRILDGQGNPVTNQFRISDMGPDANANFNASTSAVAYNSQADEFLVVWHGDDTTHNEYEIYGQRVSVDGTELGTNDFRISDAGPDGDFQYRAWHPSVKYNHGSNNYLVVWNGDDTTPGNNESEVFGQTLASNGIETGTNDFRISSMGNDGDTTMSAYDASLVSSTKANEFLVVWYGDDTTDEEFEVYGQRISAEGSELGSDDFRISDMGPDGNTTFSAYLPSVAYDSHSNAYLVTWHGVDSVPGIDDREIFGQRLSADGSEIGTNDFRISDMGPDGNASYSAGTLKVTYNSGAEEFLTVWTADDSTNGEYEIYGQRIASDGAETGTNDFRISAMGPDGDSSYTAEYPSLSYNSKSNEYLVFWWGDDNSGGLVNNEYEIFTRRTGAGELVDRTAPKLTVKIKKFKLGKGRKRPKIRMELLCDENCSATYQITFLPKKKVKGLSKLKTGSVTLTAGEAKTVTVRLTKKQAKKLRKVIRPKKKKGGKRRKRKRIKVKVDASAKDAAGNETTSTATRKIAR